MAAGENETLSVLTRCGSIPATSGRMPLSVVFMEPKYSLNSSAFSNSKVAASPDLLISVTNAAFIRLFCLHICIKHRHCCRLQFSLLLIFRNYVLTGSSFLLLYDSFSNRLASLGVLRCLRYKQRLRATARRMYTGYCLILCSSL